jgi:glycosyltransferase involved in cell wall biosynthesis
MAGRTATDPACRFSFSTLNDEFSVPKISIAFTTFCEKPRFLKASLDSIQNQSEKDWELVCAVEPSDSNVDLLKEYADKDNRIKLVWNLEKIGRTPSINVAMKCCQGDYIVRFDSDDVSKLDRLAKQKSFLESHPEVAIVGCQMNLIDIHGANVGRRSYPETHKDIRSQFLWSNPMAGPGVMFRRAVLSEVGYFDERYERAEDFQYWLRCLAKGMVFANHPDVLMDYRIPMLQMGRRDRLHWFRVYEARREWGLKIWPLPVAKLSTILFYWVMVLSQKASVILESRISNKCRGVQLKETGR